MRSLYTILILTLLSLACSGISCSRSKEQETLDHAEELMESHPDSAMMILSSIDQTNLSGKRQKAHYALLMSMALDKNYIDTTTFDVLQPAIDYYLENGSPDEKLRTYYYQGRIFQNQGDRDNALNSFVKGVNNAVNCTDSISLIRAYAAQAYLFHEFYDFDSYTKFNLKAANLCNHLWHKDYEFECLLNALNGSIITGSKNLADSILNLCNDFRNLNQNQLHNFLGHKLSYALKFGSRQDIQQLRYKFEDILESNTNGKLNLALAYSKSGDNDKAKFILDEINNCGLEYDTLKYQSTTVMVLKELGYYKDALSIYRDFSVRVDSINNIKFDQKATTIREKHQLELNAQEEERRNAKIIWACVGGIIFLIMVVIILLLLFRSNKSKKDLAIERVKTTELENMQLKSVNEMAIQKAKITELENEKLKSEKQNAIQQAKISELENDRLKDEKSKAIQQAKISELENERLKSERENLALENKNLQLERDKKALEAENLAHRVEDLENESDSLKALIRTPKELPLEVRREIKVRIEMLNSLLASYITDNVQYEKPYEIWIRELTDNKDEFMNSNRLAFQVSHPKFIQYFEDHGLTSDEINYVCLYAIGLRGKEVGNYIKKRSHVNISSAIRKKLGIDKHETNIGIYVRQLLQNL